MFVALVGALVGARAGHLTLQPSVHGDARLASSRTYTSTTGAEHLWQVCLPAGQHEAFTVCGWVRLTYTGVRYITTAALWSPEAVEMDNPDLLEGAGGYGTSGTNLTTLGGSVTVAEFPYEPYTDAVLLAKWTNGVYTVAGWASNAVTVTLGGTDYTVGPGEFNRNVVPGPAASCVISGGGLVAIGMSRTPGCRFYQEINGVKAGGFFSSDSIITNEIAFVAYRFAVAPDNTQIYRSNLSRLDNNAPLSQTKTNAMSAALFDSQGIYKVGVMGLGSTPPITFDMFDFRVLGWWVSDAELEAIRRNGAQEIERRGIQQWR